MFAKELKSRKDELNMTIGGRSLSHEKGIPYT